ncbi:unnamed protein product [Sympodiomycopsis kandeliae]
MCKHITNAQVSIRAPCCQRFFDCPECHSEVSDHQLRKTIEMTFVCKKCRRAFRKDLSRFEDADEYCPHCDNCYVIQADVQTTGESGKVDKKVEKGLKKLEDESRIDSGVYQALDPRMKYNPNQDFHTEDYRALNNGERVEHGGIAGVMASQQQQQQQRQQFEQQELAAAGGDFAAIDDDLDWS